jgi:hypothetical protein
LGTDAAYQIEVVFHWLNKDEDLIAKACYDDFVTYKRKQSQLFTEDINDFNKLNWALINIGSWHDYELGIQE